MRKNLSLILIVLLLCLILYLLKIKRDRSNLQDADFRIEDMSEIGSIEIADKSGNMTSLVLNGEKWLVNNEYPVEKLKLKSLLETLNKIEVDIPVSDTLRPIAIENLRQFGTEVKIKNKDGEEIKTIFIGGEYQNNNYMILSEGGIVSPNPYLVKIPGFKGNLKYRFLAITKMWKSTSVFSTPIDKIQNISVHHYDNPQYSFTLTKDEEVVKIEPILDSLRIERKLDQNKVVQFLLEFEDKHFENWLEGDTIIREIKSKNPYASIELVDVFNKKKKIIFFRKPPNRFLKQVDATGKPLPFDIEKYWCFLPESKEYVITQHYVFGPILETYDYFFEEENK